MASFERDRPGRGSVPDQLTAIVRAGLESVVDLAALDAVHRRSEHERNELVAEMARIHRR